MTWLRSLDMAKSQFGEILTENGWKHRISQNPKNVNFVARIGMIWDLGLLRSQLSRQYFSSNEKGALGFDWPLLCRFYLASIGLWLKINLAWVQFAWIRSSWRVLSSQSLGFRLNIALRENIFTSTMNWSKFNFNYCEAQFHKHSKITCLEFAAAGVLCFFLDLVEIYYIVLNIFTFAQNSDNTIK